MDKAYLIIFYDGQSIIVKGLNIAHAFLNKGFDVYDFIKVRTYFQLIKKK